MDHDHQFENPFEVLSDESDFYGDEPDDAFGSDRYWAYADKLAYNVAFKARHNASLTVPKKVLEVVPPTELNSRQKNETVEAFIKRLPPSSTLERVVGSWIWMRNVHAKRAREPSEDNIKAFIKEGQQKLDEFAAATSGKLLSGRSKSVKMQKLEQTLMGMAKRHELNHGKWMLFPTERGVDKTWKTICMAMATGELGPTAKVATKSDSGAWGSTRLICIYTDEFEDEADVKRVVQRLDDLGLIPKKGIWYKADAWTYLNLTSKNSYGIRASIYSSQEMLK